MTQGTNRIFDDMAKLMNDAAGIAGSVRREVETIGRAQIERFMAEMDLVSREEFDAVKELAANARAKNDELSARIEELEKQLAQKG